VAFDHLPEELRPTVEDSERWLRNFAAISDCPDYEDLLEMAVQNDVDDSFGGEESYLDSAGWMAHGSIPAEFWDHVENVTGKTGLKRATYFSCSC
jgi:hypothetical protein